MKIAHPKTALAGFTVMILGILWAIFLPIQNGWFRKEQPGPWQREKVADVEAREDVAIRFTNEVRARKDSNGIDVLDFVTSMPGTSVMATIVAPTNMFHLSPFYGYSAYVNQDRSFTSKWVMGFAAAAPTNTTNSAK